MNTEQLIRKIKNVLCDYYQRETVPGIKLLHDIERVIEQYELEKRVEEGKERIFVARFPKLNYLIALPETQFKQKPQEWIEKTPFDVEIKVSYRMFKYEEDFDIKRHQTIINKLYKNEDITPEEQEYIEKTMRIGKDA